MKDVLKDIQDIYTDYDTSGNDVYREKAERVWDYLNKQQKPLQLKESDFTFLQENKCKSYEFEKDKIKVYWNNYCGIDFGFMEASGTRLVDIMYVEFGEFLEICNKKLAGIFNAVSEE